MHKRCVKHIQGKDLGQQGGVKPEEVDWQDNGLEGKLDLVVTLDFRLRYQRLWPQQSAISRTSRTFCIC